MLEAAIVVIIVILSILLFVKVHKASLKREKQKNILIDARPLYKAQQVPLEGSISVLSNWACRSLMSNDPFEIYRVPEFDNIMKEMSLEEKQRFALEVLIFEIFCVNFYIDNLPENINKNFYLYTYEIISHHEKSMEIIKDRFWKDMLKSHEQSNIEITNEALLQFFEVNLLRPRYSEYSQSLGEYPVTRSNLTIFSHLVAKNMLGNKSSNPLIDIVFTTKIKWVFGRLGKTVIELIEKSNEQAS